VLAPDRRAHGRTPDTDGPMTFDEMADDTIRFLEQQSTGSAPLLGYSDGAVVALLVALRRRDLVSHLVFVSGVFSLDGWPARTLDADVPEFMADAYAEVSPDGLARGARGEAGPVPRPHRRVPPCRQAGHVCAGAARALRVRLRSADAGAIGTTARTWPGLSCERIGPLRRIREPRPPGRLKTRVSVAPWPLAQSENVGLLRD